MTQRLPFYLSVSLLAHLAVLLTWHGVPVTPPNLTEPGSLQIALVHAAQQASSIIAAVVPAPHAPSLRHTSTAAHSTIRTHRRHNARLAAATPITAQTTPTAVHATNGAPTTQLITSNLSADSEAHLQNALRFAFNSYFSYPAIALRHGWAGVVKLSLRLEPDGRLSEIRLIQSSGHSALDAAALATAQRIPPLHEVMTWLQGNSHVILLPVEYRLIDG